MSCYAAAFAVGAAAFAAARSVFDAIWQFCRYLFWPPWGSKRRRAQEEYERMLEEGRVK